MATNQLSEAQKVDSNGSPLMIFSYYWIDTALA
jgi:hypothetical protein